MEHVRCPMGQQCITFHLAQPDASAQLAALDGLPRQGIDGPRRPHLELVAHHVPQPACRRRSESCQGVRTRAMRPCVFMGPWVQD